MTTVGYHGDGSGGNKDKDNNKGNIGKNMECGGNNKDGTSHLCLFWGLMT